MSLVLICGPVVVSALSGGGGIEGPDACIYRCCQSEGDRSEKEFGHCTVEKVQKKIPSPGVE